MGTFSDLTGERFGRLVVIERVGTDRNKKPLWKCRCDCGNTTIVTPQPLKEGRIKSCGCLHQERMNAGNIKHGKRYSRLYKIWVGISQRTNNEKNPSYKHYGGRGICVCDEWLNDFQAFYDWSVTNGYNDNLTLDRIDNDGNYEPSNCRWATQKEQMNNTRVNRLITLDGETHTVKEWSEITGIPSNVIHARIHKLRWSEQEAITKEVKGR